MANTITLICKECGCNVIVPYSEHIINRIDDACSHEITHCYACIKDMQAEAKANRHSYVIQR